MNNCNGFILTITIPTKNRQKYAEAAVRQISSINELIQIVISDNSDDDSLKSMIMDLIDGRRIKYVFTDHPIPVVRNYSIAAENADGEFLCAIGDDDGILSNIIDLCHWMKENQVDAVKPSKNLSYIWPSDKSTGLLCIDKMTKTIRPMDTENAIIKLLENGGQGYLNLDLIGSYHCIVSMKMMREVKNKTGFYYSGASPDMYSAVCLSSLQGYNCLSIDYPFTLPGVCPKSTSFEGKNGSDAGTVNTAPHFSGNSDYRWDKRVPYYYTAASIWAETMMHALEAVGREKIIKKHFNEKVLINTMYWGNFTHSHEMLEYLSDSQKNLIDDSFSINYSRYKRIKRMIRVFFQFINGDYLRKHKVKDIYDAVMIADKYLNRNKLYLKCLATQK